jgi:phosphoenolpyruvate phosphomutase
MDGKTVIIYSDILFEHSLIERLKALESDFVIVVDNSYKKTLRRNKKLDLVLTKEELVSGDRILTYDKLYEVRKIGSEIAPEAASAELVGITMFSKKGTEIFKKEYHEVLTKHRDKPFHGAKNLAQASLENFLQHLIDAGYKVEALQINSGWLEIHSFENYKYACSIVK